MFFIASAISFLIALGCLFAGVNTLIKQRRKQVGFMSASGIVLELQKRILNPGSAGVYCPVVEFRTGSGEVVRFDSSFGTMPAAHKVGQAVKVLYDPKEPRSAEIESELTKWLVPGFLLAFAVFAAFFCVMFLGLHFLIASSGS